MRDSVLRVTRALRPPQASLPTEGLSGWLLAMAASRKGRSPSAGAYLQGALRNECSAVSAVSKRAPLCLVR